MVGPGVVLDTERLFLPRNWSLAGGHPGPGPSVPQAKPHKEGKPTSRAGFDWTPHPRVCSSGCAHPWGAGGPVGVPGAEEKVKAEGVIQGDHSLTGEAQEMQA